MDGLLLDTEGLYRKTWQGAATALGYELDDEHYDSLIGLAELDAEARLTALFGDAFPLSHFRGLWRQAWDRFLAEDRLAAKPGAEELLAMLETRGIPSAVATSTARETAVRCLRSAGLLERLPLLVAGDEVPRGKPAPDIFLAASLAVRCEPCRCLALEDSANGLLSAVAAGTIAILVPEAPVAAETQALAAYVCPTLFEVRELLAPRG
jgi:HAD superfamily hydrolase (TIGR01509 family)